MCGEAATYCVGRDVLSYARYLGIKSTRASWLQRCRYRLIAMYAKNDFVLCEDYCGVGSRRVEKVPVRTGVHFRMQQRPVELSSQRGCLQRRRNNLAKTGAARYISTSALLTMHFEIDANMVWFAWTQARMDVWMGYFATLLKTDKLRIFKLRTVWTGGRFLRTGARRKLEIWNENVLLSSGNFASYFLFANEPEEKRLYVCQESQFYKLYRKTDKRAFTVFLQMKAAKLPLYGELFGHAYMQHTGAVFLPHHRLQYSLYFVPDDFWLQDTIVSSYKWNL